MGIRRVAVVGGGITGLAAGHALATSQAAPEVVVLEAADRLGGKLLSAEVGGSRVELGAEAFLARERGAIELCRRLGLGDELVGQAARGVGVWWEGSLRSLPEGVVLGIPTRLRSVATSGLITPWGALRAAADLVLPRDGDLVDRSLGEVVRRRLGSQVAERLVEPLLSGVYAGDIDRLSATAAAPILADALREHRSLILGARARAARGDGRSVSGAGGPAFVTLRGGLGSLVERLAETAGVEVRTGAAVTSIDPSGAGFELGSAAGALSVDGVIVTTPAPVTADLLGPISSTAAEALLGVPYASVAVVVLVLPPGTVVPDGSGILVPRATGRTVKAATWVSSKWQHVGGEDAVVVRASVGRAGDDELVDRPDEEIVRLVRGDLAALADIRAEPTALHVRRWRGGLPQYDVGHEDRVARVRAEVERLPGLEVAGAAYDGIGIPACITSGQQAAHRLLRSRPRGR